MKKLLPFFIFILTAQWMFAQNVGIDVTNPSYKLHVGNATNGFRVEGPATAGGTALSIGGLGNILIDKPGTAGGRFIILENGNVGIGEINPGFPLNFGSILGEKISFYGNSGSNYGIGVQGGLLQIHANLAADDIAFGTGSSVNFSENMRIKGNGNVGIGTVTPQGYGHGGNNKILEIKNPNSSTNSQAQLILSTGASDGSMGGITWAQNNIVSNPMTAFLGCVLDPFNTGSRMVFYTRNNATPNVLSEKMTINGNGNVGINTTNPLAKLDVGGNARITNGTLLFKMPTDSSNSIKSYNGYLVLGGGDAGGGNGVWINNTGSVFGGTKFQTSGAIEIAGSEGSAGQVLTSNGTGNAARWVNTTKYGSTAVSTANINIDNTLFYLSASEFSINLSVPSRVILTYKVRTTKPCALGTCLTKWELDVEKASLGYWVPESSYFVIGQSVVNSFNRGVWTDDTLGPDVFDLPAGVHSFRFRGYNIFNLPEVQFQAFYTIVPL